MTQEQKELIYAIHGLRATLRNAAYFEKSTNWDFDSEEEIVDFILMVMDKVQDNLSNVNQHLENYYNITGD